MSLIFPFDPDIRRAATIPSRLYVDPVYLALEEEKIFGRTWQLVGRRDQLEENDPPADAGSDPSWTRLVRFSDEIQFLT